MGPSTACDCRQTDRCRNRPKFSTQTIVLFTRRAQPSRDASRCCHRWLDCCSSNFFRRTPRACRVISRNNVVARVNVFDSLVDVGQALRALLVERRERAHSDDELLGCEEGNLRGGTSKVCLHCGQMLLGGCDCENTELGRDVLIHPDFMPPPPPTMYPADHLVRSVKLCDLTGGAIVGRRNLQPLADNSDVVVALVRQHKAGLLQAVDAVNTSEKLEELLREVYNKRDADPAALKVVKEMMLGLFDVADAESGRRWLSSSAKLFCSSSFAKLTSVHLSALHVMVREVANMSDNHFLAMTDIFNILFDANESLFACNFYSAEMEEDDIVLTKSIGL